MNFLSNQELLIIISDLNAFLADLAAQASPHPITDKTWDRGDIADFLQEIALEIRENFKAIEEEEE